MHASNFYMLLKSIPLGLHLLLQINLNLSNMLPVWSKLLNFDRHNHYSSHNPSASSQTRPCFESQIILLRVKTILLRVKSEMLNRLQSQEHCPFLAFTATASHTPAFTSIHPPPIPHSNVSDPSGLDLSAPAVHRPCAHAHLLLLQMFNPEQYTPQFWPSLLLNLWHICKLNLKLTPSICTCPPCIYFLLQSDHFYSRLHYPNQIR
jgi:hypothetical protein